MLKKTIVFNDLDGNEIADDFHFHLSTAELAELELSKSGGFETYFTRILAAEDGPSIVALLKEIIDMAYGVRHEDGRQFIKNQDVLQAFKNTDAYSELWMELAFDARKAAEFINGCLPEKIAKQLGEDAVENAVLQAEQRASGVEEKKDVREMTRAELIAAMREKSQANEA